MELALNGITRWFDGVQVIDRVDFSVRGGEIHALIGENGAGKSTLMNVAGGLIRPHGGELLLDGKQQFFSAPQDSIRAGIAFIHQELNLINDLTVYENLFLRHFPTKRMLPDKALMKAKAAELFETLGVEIDPCVLVKTLDASCKQITEIAAALLAEPGIIIMDEPTSSLNTAEIERVFSVIRTLRDRGVGIVFISHKLNEVMELCDRYTVLRGGKVVSVGRIAETDPQRLASLMVGHEVTVKPNASHSRKSEEVLKLEHFSDRKHFFDISLSLRRGEILGVTGLLGDGRSELFGSLFGAYGKWFDGRVTVDGEPMLMFGTHRALKRGICYLPKNRKENAIIKDCSVLDNATLTTLDRFSRCGVLQEKKRMSAFSRWAEELAIKTGSPFTSIVGLSGGNQQKVLLAKLLMAEPKVLILDNPTQGVDVGAKEEIYSIIQQFAEQGTSVIVLSSEAPEMIRLCDRVLVMFHGRIAGEVSGAEMTERNMMILATGAGEEERQ